jgi:hypothetical protein
MIGYDADGNGVLTNSGDATYGYDDGGQRVSMRTGTSPNAYYLNDANNPSGCPQIVEEKLGATPQTATLARSYVLGLRGH